MIEFFVERVRSEKVGNGAGAGASKMGRGICGFSIPPPVRRTGDGWDRMIPRLPPNICVWISLRFGCRLDADALRTPPVQKEFSVGPAASRNIYMAHISSVTRGRNSQQPRYLSPFIHTFHSDRPAFYLRDCPTHPDRLSLLPPSSCEIE